MQRLRWLALIGAFTLPPSLVPALLGAQKRAITFADYLALDGLGPFGVAAGEWLAVRETDWSGRVRCPPTVSNHGLAGCVTQPYYSRKGRRARPRAGNADTNGGGKAMMRRRDFCAGLLAAPALIRTAAQPTCPVTICPGSCETSPTPVASACATR